MIAHVASAAADMLAKRVLNCIVELFAANLADRDLLKKDSRGHHKPRRAIAALEGKIAKERFVKIQLAYELLLELNN